MINYENNQKIKKKSVPGGFNALQRIYRELEEPMLNATRDQFNQNPFAALMGNNTNTNNTGTENRQAGTENTQPLPNPWAPRTNTTSSSSSTTTTTTSSTTGSTNTSTANNPLNNIFSQMLGNIGSSSGSTPSTATTGANTQSSTPTANPMQDYMQQMLNNPRQMESILNAPYMQSMLQMISQNPDMSRLIVENSPQLAGNPDLRDQVTRSMPALLTQVNFYYFLISNFVFYLQHSFFSLFKNSCKIQKLDLC